LDTGYQTPKTKTKTKTNFNRDAPWRVPI
jgi:hypothetical protein